YIGSAFLSTNEANVVDDYRRMVGETGAEDVVYSSYFTGVKGNYLPGSIIASGLDPDNLPPADPSTMAFGSDPNPEATAWPDLGAEALARRRGPGAGQRGAGRAPVDRRPRRRPGCPVRGGEAAAVGPSGLSPAARDRPACPTVGSRAHRRPGGSDGRDDAAFG